MLYLLAVVVLIVDQLTKLLALSALQSRGSVPVIPSVLSFRLRYNAGAAFGLMGGCPPLLVVVAVIIILVLWGLGRGAALRNRVLLVGIALQVGGAAGNLLDRLRLGYVLDFIDVHLTGTYTWPTFNAADIAICCGALLMAYVLVTTRADESETPATVKHQRQRPKR